MKAHSIRLILTKLLNDGKIRGIITNDQRFITDRVLEKLIVDVSVKLGRINVSEISQTLLIPVEKVLTIIGDVEKRVIDYVKIYNQVKISELSNETRIPRNFLILLLKKIIQDGQIRGYLNMVDQILVLEKIEEPSVKVELKTVKSKPSSAWYLAPILLGIIGGIIGYLAVRDEDKEMAQNMLLVGFAMSIIETVIIMILLQMMFSWMLRIIFRS